MWQNNAEKGLRMENTQTEFRFIAPSHAGRLDSVMSKESGLSRSKVKKLIDDGFITVNSNVCTNAALRLIGGEEIVMQNPQKDTTLVASEAPLEIMYQDDDIAVIVKNAGLTVHPCPSCEEETLVHQLLHHFPQLKKMEGERPGIVHRLDKDTSGLMIIALHEEARLRLATAFADKEVNKTYLALVPGLCAKDESKESIGRHPTYKTKMAQVPLNKGGREAHSEWERLYPPVFDQPLTKLGKNVPLPKEFQSSFSLVAVKIFTGRTHQVRVHMSEAGYPLLGDSTYAPKAIAKLAPRQMLHAWKLNFEHPMTREELSFICPLPMDFMQTVMNIWAEENCFQKIIITGNSGTGKTALLDAFAEKNIPTFNADACVQSLYEPHADAWYLLRSQYGQRFVHDEEEAVDKQALFDAMQDNVMRREIENIIHPLVSAKLEAFFADQQKLALQENASKALFDMKSSQGESSSQADKQESNEIEKMLTISDSCRFGVAEVPLWYEAKLADKVKDASVICVTCDTEVRWERLRARSWSEKTIAKMDSWQWTQEDKAKASQYVLDNTDDLAILTGKVDGILLELRENQKKHLAKKIKTLQKAMLNYKENDEE